MRLLRHNSIDPWHEVDRLFGTFRGESSWLPAFDVEETDSAYVLRGDIPGIAQKDIQVRIDEGVLSVSGERKTVASDEDRRRFSRRERRGGQFARRFWLPDTVDSDSVKASYDNGVVELTLPKREPEDTSRLIPVQ